MLDAEFFSGNRERLRQLFTGTAPVVIAANALLEQSAGEAYPFSQDRSFYYLTGVEEPGAILVMDKGKEYLIIPSKETVVEQFVGATSIDALSALSGIRTIMFAKEGWKQLEARIRKVQHVATLAPAPRSNAREGIYANPARAEMVQRMKDINPHVELLDLSTHLSRMRMVKQPAELVLIQQAIDVTGDTLKAILRSTQQAKYAHEFEIEAELTRGFRRKSFLHAFPPIVASGKRSCTMHAMANNAPLVAGEPLVCDVGAQAGMYAADITRTLIVGGNPTRRQQQVYDAVKEVQDFAFSLLKPGVVLSHYETEVADFMGEKLRELGLIKSISDDTIRRYFPHRTSHFLGLDVHDIGDYDHPLEPGVVLTVEPGIYIPEEALGVRIEDDVLITAEGMQNLSAALPRTLDRI